MNMQHHKPTPSNSGRMWAGIIIVGIGAILLAGKMGLGYLFPIWIFNWGTLWPVLFLVAGLVIGGNSNFRNPAAVFFILFGGFFVLRNILNFDIGPFIWPCLVIGIGLWLLFGRKSNSTRFTPPGPHTRPKDPYRNRYSDHPFEWDKRVQDEYIENPMDPEQTGTSGFSDPLGTETNENAFSSDDYLKSTAVFSDIKKTVISKHFRGGEVVNIFGGTDLNLIQAEIKHPIVIDVFQLFAGTKIIVPSHWRIKSEVVSVFGEVDDRRFTQGVATDDQKVVYIKGTSIFGGITIKSI